MRTLRVTWLFLKVGVLNQLQYRVNFFVSLLQSLVQVVTGLVVLALVYSHTTELDGGHSPSCWCLLGIQILLGGVIRAFIQPNMMQLMEDVPAGDARLCAHEARKTLRCSSACAGFRSGRPLTSSPG